MVHIDGAHLLIFVLKILKIVELTVMKEISLTRLLRLVENALWHSALSCKPPLVTTLHSVQYTTFSVRKYKYTKTNTNTHIPLSAAIPHC